MPSLKILLTSALLTTGLLGCESEKVNPAQNYLVFGWYHGFCQGESCIDIFKIDNASHQLYEDTTDQYPSSSTPYEGRYVLKSSADYQQVQALPQQIPAQLLTQPVGIIGQPDFTDGGGYYVEILDNGQRKFWLIDTNKSNIPTYLHPFVDEVSANIQALQ